jgi:hypothetical protein
MLLHVQTEMDAQAILASRTPIPEGAWMSLNLVLGTHASANRAHHGSTAAAQVRAEVVDDHNVLLLSG